MTNELDISQVTAYVVPPQAVPHTIKLNSRGEGSYVPDKYGMHEILVEVDNDKLGGHFFRVLPRLIQVSPPGMAPCK